MSSFIGLDQATADHPVQDKPEDFDIDDFSFTEGFIKDVSKQESSESESLSVFVSLLENRTREVFYSYFYLDHCLIDWHSCI